MYICILILGDWRDSYCPEVQEPEIRSAESRIKPDPQLENAKYNLEFSAYQGKITQGKLGDPASNYEFLRQKQSVRSLFKRDRSLLTGYWD